MYLPILVAWNSPIGLTHDDIASRLDRTERCTSLSGESERREVHQGKTGFAAWHRPQAALSLNLWQQEAGDRVATCAHLPLGISNVTNLDLTSDQLLLDLANRLIASPTLASNLHPPQIIFCTDPANQRVIIVNDFLGFGRLYQIETPKLSVWSNYLGALLAFFGKVPPPSWEGWASYEALGWFMEHYTPFHDVTVASPSTYIQLDGLSGTSERRNYEGFSRVLSAFAGEADNISLVSQGFGRFFRELDSFTRGPYRLGLSGGRDSRLIAAFALANQVDLAIHTQTPPQLELDLVRELHGRGPELPNWSTSERAAPFEVQNLSERVLAWLVTSGGDTFPTAIMRNAPSELQGNVQSFRLTGAGGEFAHANFYQDADILKRTSDERISAMEKSFFGKAPFLHSRPASFSAELFRGLVGAASKYGLTGFQRLDYFYAFGRFRRWADGNSGIENVLPLLTPEFVSVGLTQRVEEKTSSQLHRQAIERIQPQWAEVPFFHEVSGSSDPRRVTRVGSQPYIWESAAWQEFRELVSDAGHLDDFVDREGLLATLDEYHAAYKRGDVGQTLNRQQNMAYRVLWLSLFPRYVRHLGLLMGGGSGGLGSMCRAGSFEYTEGSSGTIGEGGQE